jgi:hypothetical protein
LLSPSGSWLSAELYVSVEWVTLSTVNLTLPVRLGMLLLLTAHWPLLFVVQEAVPEAPLLQVPLTVALDTGLWLLS